MAKSLAEYIDDGEQNGNPTEEVGLSWRSANGSARVTRPVVEDYQNDVADLGMEINGRRPSTETEFLQNLETMKDRLRP